MKKLLSIITFFTLLALPIFVEAGDENCKCDTKKELTKYQNGILINVSERQSILTQKMSKEALFIAKGINSEDNKESLKKSIALFDKVIKGLVNSDEGLNLPVTSDNETLGQIGKVYMLWSGFKSNINKVAEGKVNKEILKMLAKDNVPLLNEMNKVVKMYEKNSNLKLNPKIEEKINIADKQILLIQKMTKELLLIANNIEATNNSENIKQTSRQFDATLKKLQYKCTKSNVKEQLEEVTALWNGYKDIVETINTSEASLKKAEEMNVALLKSMNRAIVLFKVVNL